MSSNQKEQGAFVKQETMFIVAVVMLVAGFIAGVIFTTYRQVEAEKSLTDTCANKNISAQTDPSQAQMKNAMAELQLLEKDSKLHPENAEIFIQIGNTCFDAGMYEKAIDAYEKALKIGPDNANVQTDLGVMYRRMKKPEEAVKAFQKAAQIDPSHEMSRFNLGVVLMHDLGDMTRAIEAWEELVKINPQAKGPGGQLVSEFIEKTKSMEK